MLKLFFFFAFLKPKAQKHENTVIVDCILVVKLHKHALLCNISYF